MDTLAKKRETQRTGLAAPVRLGLAALVVLTADFALRNVGVSHVQRLVVQIVFVVLSIACVQAFLECDGRK